MKLLRNRTKVFAAVALSGSLFASTVVAQSIESWRRAEKPASDGSVDVTVQYSFVMPLESLALDQQMQAMDTGRAMLYQATGKECAHLVATIAASCALLRLAVQSQAQRVTGGQAPSIVMGGSATFRITPKTP